MAAARSVRAALPHRTTHLALITGKSVKRPDWRAQSRPALGLGGGGGWALFLGGGGLGGGGLGGGGRGGGGSGGGSLDFLGGGGGGGDLEGGGGRCACTSMTLVPL